MKRRQRRLLNLFSLSLLSVAMYLNFFKTNRPELVFEQEPGKPADMAITGQKPQTKNTVLSTSPIILK